MKAIVRILIAVLPLVAVAPYAWAFMRQISTPLTSDTAWTVYVAGDLGAAFVVVALVVAFAFWRRRSEVPMAPA